MAQLIVALDVPTADEAEQLIDELYEFDLIFKVGMESLYGYGERLFSYMEARDVRHFIDAKLHDIPRTVAAGVTQLVRHGTHIINVHALGGSAMMRAAVEAAQRRCADLGMSTAHVFAVTLLTSMGEADVAAVGLPGSLGENALRLAALAQDAGCSGVVCSAQESAQIKAALGQSFLTLTPGIRPHGEAHGDQKRVTTPAQAVRAGADYLVVGRPITGARDRAAAVRSILEEMRGVPC